MDLLREWRRRMVGGTAAAVLVPVAIVVASLSIGLGGGLRGLGALGQSLTGPELPGVEPAVGRTARADDSTGELLAAATGPALDSAAAGPAGERARRRSPRRSSRRPSRGSRPGATPPPGAGRPPPSATTPPPQPTPPPGEPPSTVRQVGNTVKSVTDRVPIAGEPAGKVVDTIVETAEMLPLP